MTYILDTGVFPHIPLELLHKEEFVTTSSVLEEMVNWRKAEKKSKKWDQSFEKFRPGFLYAEKRTQEKLDGLMSHYRLNFDWFCSMFSEFDNAVDVYNYFFNNPDLVWDEEVSDDYQRFKGLLVKTIAYDVCKSNLVLVSNFKPSVIESCWELVDLAHGLYQKRSNEIFGMDFLNEGIKGRISRRVIQICYAAYGSPHLVRAIDDFRNGVKADISLVACANDIEEAEIVSRDWDVKELVNYTNIMYKNSVKVLFPNHVVDIINGR